MAHKVKRLPDPMAQKESSDPTPYGVHCTGVMEGHECNKGEIIYLTQAEYDRQLSNPNRRWKCPRCNHDALWDDENYEKFFG